MTKKHELKDLETLYIESEGVDKDIFAEMRSNLLLIDGNHYAKKNAAFNQRIRDNKELSEQQKLRLTKNHTQKIVRTYVNNIVGLAPGVGISAHEGAEIQDQKAAELHHAVWNDAKEKHGLDERVDDWCDDFVGIGEVATKIFWDPNTGKIVNYSQKQHADGKDVWLDADGGETTEHEPDLYGQPTLKPAKGAPIYSGGFVFEEIYGFNLLRAPEAKDMKKSPYLTIRKMSDLDGLLANFSQHQEKIKESMDETMIVFDAAKSGYAKAGKQVMVKETYFRPCPLYPMGYFYIFTKEVILAEGELPGGKFPIIFQTFEKIQTTPRGRSPVKTIRPYQAEINRAASKMAEHQITLGDDKLLIQNGTKVSAGNALPGIRSVNYTGMTPEILQGRGGEQYLAYMQSQIEELYRVMNMEDDAVGADSGAVDPHTLIFRAAHKKAKFVRYIKRFERFLIEVARLYLELAKIHLPDDAFISAVGKREQVNIAEFRNQDDLCYQIKLEAQSEDIETKMGKQMVLNHLIQYTGGKLDKEDIGKIVKLMPYANLDEGFNDLTMDYDNATNDLLALDRGERPVINEYDSHVYNIKRLVSRMRSSDFPFLAPEIQEAYKLKINIHEQMQMAAVKAAQAATDGFVPTGGYMVTVDLYVSDPQNPQKTKRARLPYEAVKWLIERLEAQGQSLEELENMNQGALAQMGSMAVQQQNGAGSNGMGSSPPQGAGMPHGASNDRRNGSPDPHAGNTGQPASTVNLNIGGKPQSGGGVLDLNAS